MGLRPSEPQWLAARELGEGGAQTRAMIARVLGVGVRTVNARARAEGWRALDFRHADVRAAQRAMVRRAMTHGERRGDGDPMIGPMIGPMVDSAVDPASDGAGDAPDVEVPDVEGRDGEADAVALLARASRFVSRQVERLMKSADRDDGRLDKSQIDALVSLSRVMEQWESLAREQATTRRKTSDEELAEIHRRIDRRILELADEHARRMVAEGGGG